MNTCKLTIDHHPDTDQCGEDMITHAVHVEPINVDLPQWINDAATKHMCADPRHNDDHFMPHVDPAIKVMEARGFSTVVVLAPDYWGLEDAFWFRDSIGVVGARLCRLDRAFFRPVQHTAAVIDLTAGTVVAVTRKEAWDAK